MNAQGEGNIGSLDNKEGVIPNDAEGGLVTPMMLVGEIGEDEIGNPKSYTEAPFRFMRSGSESVILNNGSLQYTETDFVLPGRNGFDLVVSRRYNSDSAGINEMQPDPYTSKKFRTNSRTNHHNLRTYGLGVGWYFVLPSIELTPSSEQLQYVIYSPFLHLEDGRNFNIDKMSTVPELKDHSFKDVMILRSSGTVNHPYNSEVSGSYDIVIVYKNGNKDYFKEILNNDNKAESYKLIARQDRFGNTISYDMTDSGGMTVTDSWGRKITLVHSGEMMTWTLPDNSKIRYVFNDIGCQRLTEVRDQNNRRTGYDYHDPDVYKAQCKVASANNGDDSNILFPYVLLKTITHPTGAVTSYQYGTTDSPAPEYIELVSGEKGGFRRYFPVRTRKDTADGTDYNTETYEYTKSGDNKYISEALVTLPNGITEKHTFNDKNLEIEKEIRSLSKLTDKSEYIYGTDENSHDYKQRITEVYRHYDPDNELSYLEKTTGWTYSEDKKINVTCITESYTDDSLDQETVMVYDDRYSDMTERVIKKTSDIVIREIYELRADGKLPSYRRIYEDSELKEKNQYIYGDKDDNNNCVIQERRYYTVNGQPLDSSLCYHVVYFTYDKDKYIHSPVKTEVSGILDADGIDIPPIVSHVDYDNMGRAVSMINPNGNTTQYIYDKLGRVLSEIYPETEGKRSSKTNLYNDAGNYIVSTDERGFKQRIQYTPLGLVKAVYIPLHDNPASSDLLVEDYLYDNAERLIRERSFNEDSSVRTETEYTYDSFNRMLTKSVPVMDFLETHTYTEVFNDPEETGKKYFKHETYISGDVDAAGTCSCVYLNEAGWPVKEYSGEGNEKVRSSFSEYDKLGNKIKETDAAGNIVLWEYDYAGRNISTTLNGSNGQQTSETEYDALGNKVSSTDYLGNTTEYIYDAAGRLIKRASPFNLERDAVTRYYYDSNSNLITQSVYRGDGWRRTQYEYDVLDRQSDVFIWGIGKDSASFERTSHSYDESGNKIETRTGYTEKHNDYVSVRYEYNRFGKVICTTDALGQKEYREYDKTGRLLSKTDRNGSVTLYTYDAAGRLSEESVFNKTLLGKEILSEREYFYASTGAKVKEISRETQNGRQKHEYVIQYTYNSRGQLVRQTDPDNVVKEYIYDSRGNRMSFLLTRGGIQEISLYYAYDSLNRLSEVRKTGPSGEVIAKYGYDANGSRISKEYPSNGLETIYTYNDANLIISLSNKQGLNVISSFSYEYSEDGNQISKTETDSNGYDNTVSYEYDGMGRLIKETDPNIHTISYEYDRFGNRSRMTVEPVPGSFEQGYITEYEYDSNNRLLIETKKTKGRDGSTEIHHYFYDSNGNQTRREREELKPRGTNTSKGRIYWVTEKKEKVTLDLREYNGFDRLIHCNRDIEDIYYSYRPDGMRHSKSSIVKISGQPISETIHHWDQSNIVMESSSNGNIKSRFIRGPGLICQDIGQNSFFYLFNAHGDVVQKISQEGDVTQSYEYDAFGNQLNQATIPGTEISTDPNPFRYCGEYYDQETQELYLRNRYYDPKTGRFNREDPANSGNNWYVYCNNCPVMNSDPSGLRMSGLDMGGTGGGNFVPNVPHTPAPVPIPTPIGSSPHNPNVGPSMEGGEPYTRPNSTKKTITPVAYNIPGLSLEGGQAVARPITEANTSKDPIWSKGMFIWPVPTSFSIGSKDYLNYENKRFGDRASFRSGPHQGQDITENKGEFILAVANGYITEVIISSIGYGNHIKIKHNDTYTTLYAHCSEVLVSKGDKVMQGDIIGLIGSTGVSTGAHLHFEVHENGVAVDPLKFYIVNEARVAETIRGYRMG